jgi:adenine-specific DNA-methyltransferase
MPPKKQVGATRHQDKRVNIPTEELRDFVAEDEKNPQVQLYKRDPSLDPQLVWTGKDEQDSRDLAVPIVPIYIQEKISPQVIVDEVRRQAKADSPFPQQMSLFDDFGDMEFDKMIEFYQHEQNWSNRMILGDSLQVMASLAEKEGLKGKVQMIYFDPPYGIKFGSNWQVSTRRRDVKDGKAEDIVRQPEQIRAFRDTWQKGIHSYLAYLRDRLVSARELLTESGSIFVQIGDENVHLVRCLMDEVFGSDNFCAVINITKTSGQTDALLASVTDTLIWYSKDRQKVKYRQLYTQKGVGYDETGQYYYAQFPDGLRRRLTDDEINSSSILPVNTKPFRISDLSSNKHYSLGRVSFNFENNIYLPPAGRYWTHSPEGRERLKYSQRLFSIGKSIRFVGFLEDFPYANINNQWKDTGVSGFSSRKIYVVQTNVKVIERCLQMTTDPGDLILDPTCGSGTTAYVAEQWGRRWITIDTSRVAIALARTRLMSAKFPYFVLADSTEGVELQAELAGVFAEQRLTNSDIRKGFVYERVPHITLKDIANNPEIDEIYERWQGMLESLRERINQLLKVNWEDWQLPREVKPEWQPEVKQLLDEYWNNRRQRQAEIDASIARNSESEILYDKPYEDNRKVRVTGAFTVESLSPHRYIASDGSQSARSTPSRQNGSFETMILENLKLAGVQNTFKNERLKFDTLDSYSSKNIHAVGTYTDAEGEQRRVAVSIGSEYGTVSPQQIKAAAKEAVRGVGFDVLVVCGFAFDPHVTEEAKRYGDLQILITRMNPDLLMGEDLLKKTGSANLFMVFGEPDIEIQRQKDGRLVVEINGLDIYDPTTGQIRNNSTDDIACWFIDTNYDEESFFVRHAYFTGADEPYDQLKRALRSEINEEAWTSLNSTVSFPFERPSNGKIAVKVINHYGDEVLKVYQV